MNTDYMNQQRREDRRYIIQGDGIFSVVYLPRDRKRVIPSERRLNPVLEGLVKKLLDNSK